MAARNFKVQSVRHCRNGIIGRGFHEVRFSFTFEGREHSNAIAIVPDDMPEGNCYVIETDDSEQGWQGEYFEHQVCQAILDYRKSLVEKFHKQIAESPASRHP
jgi:hypothetical protein